ncbi:dienelactone hydrolase family protein [Synechococcus sp. CCY9202]|uniref:dienelactone hydrolase family protein n=1 Tax=Synechococcus sp. CCY9202 TaxID=174698 RepID=UPI002B1EC086|nr:dienelactone hydrolase family protein [Synechococcus sp. CCY9202]MEA5424486.1 dienelactone hydrolase family protein [Synechococcus sp. CCY9202]
MGATLPCPATPFDSPDPFRPWSARGIRRRDQLLGTLTAGFVQIPEDGGTIPVLGLYGEQDDGIKLETEVHMQAALQAASSRSRIVVSPEAPHGFHTRYRPSYRPDAAKDGWKQMLAWFQAHGAPSQGEGGKQWRAEATDIH